MRAHLLRVPVICAALGLLGCGASSSGGGEAPAPRAQPPAGPRLSDASLRALEAGGVGRLAGVIRASEGAREGGGADLALDPVAQRVARTALKGRKGGVVAFDVDSGQLRVVAATGGFDPFKTLVPPGSTLKVLQAGGALADGTITTRTRLEGDEGPYPGIVNAGGERYGSLTVGEGVVLSSNTAFVDLAKRMGAAAVERWLRRVGWGRPVAVDLPADARGTSIADVPSLTTNDGRFRDPDLFQRTTVAQLSLLAAAVAGDGSVPRLSFTADRDRSSRRPVWGAKIAAQLRAMMRRAVVEGTGTTMLDDDIAIAAKTGTMPRGDGLNQTSVIAVAPADKPTVAIAVSLAAPGGETGGSAAGPIVRTVLRRLLSGTG